jgi:hypothetical protein
MLLRIVAFGFAGLVLVLGLINAATKSGLIGDAPLPTRIAGDRITLTLPPQWHADTGEFAPVRDDLCRLLASTKVCAAYFLKGSGSPRAVLALAIGPAIPGSTVSEGLKRIGAEVSPAVDLMVDRLFGERHRLTFVKRGRTRSLAVVDSFAAGSETVLIEIIAEEPDGRLQEKLLASIEQTLTVAPEPSAGR